MGLRLYRLTLYAFCAALEMDRSLPEDDVRPLVHKVMDAFWCHPSLAEARAWGAYPYTATRPGPPCGRWPGRSARRGGLPAAIARGWRDRLP